MSGFDSYDSAEGDMSYFGGEGFMSYADGDQQGGFPMGNASIQQSQPYVVQYVNGATSNVTAYLFGYNLYALTAYFNNAATTTVTNLQGGGQTYSSLLLQTSNKPFRISKFRFQSTTASQLTQTFNVNYVDANGNTMSTPLNLSILLDAYQQQATVIDVPFNVTVDANTYISFTLIASATLVISMFPTSIVSAKAQLNGGAALNQMRAPKLSGGNVAPVIIQTTQGVQGVRG
jgi:hypothetical protein